MLNLVHIFWVALLTSSSWSLKRLPSRLRRQAGNARFADAGLMKQLSIRDHKREAVKDRQSAKMLLEATEGVEETDQGVEEIEEGVEEAMDE